jgi:hypothetical protein
LHRDSESAIVKLATARRVYRKNAAVALDDTNHGKRERGGVRQKKGINTREMGLRDSIILFVGRVRGC